MQARWNVYCFDYARYLELRPRLRSAVAADAFASLLEGPEGKAIEQAVSEQTLTPEEARNALVTALCCVGDPLPLDAKFPRFLAALARRNGAEDAAEALGALVSGGKPVEAWLNAPDGIIGWLTPDETQALYRSYSPLTGRRVRSMARVGRASGRRIRRGGLVGVIVSFVRHLFNSGPQPDDLLRLLGHLLKDAQEQGYGLAVTPA
jgi:hypothetical protein